MGFGDIKILIENEDINQGKKIISGAIRRNHPDKIGTHNGFSAETTDHSIRVLTMISNILNRRQPHIPRQDIYNTGTLLRQKLYLFNPETGEYEENNHHEPGELTSQEELSLAISNIILETKEIYDLDFDYNGRLYQGEKKQEDGDRKDYELIDRINKAGIMISESNDHLMVLQKIKNRLVIISEKYKENEITKEIETLLADAIRYLEITKLFYLYLNSIIDNTIIKLAWGDGFVMDCIDEKYHSQEELVSADIFSNFEWILTSIHYSLLRFPVEIELSMLTTMEEIKKKYAELGSVLGIYTEIFEKAHLLYQNKGMIGELSEEILFELVCFQSKSGFFGTDTMEDLEKAIGTELFSEMQTGKTELGSFMNTLLTHGKTGSELILA